MDDPASLLPAAVPPATLLPELLELRRAMERIEAEEADSLAGIDSRYLASARNLLHFIAFHCAAPPRLAKRLRERGLSSLAGCDAYLMAELDAVIDVLVQLEGGAAPPPATPPVPPPVAGRHEGRDRIRLHRKRLFGTAAETLGATIMVTLPSDAADDPILIPELMQAGMTIARTVRRCGRVSWSGCAMPSRSWGGPAGSRWTWPGPSCAPAPCRPCRG